MLTETCLSTLVTRWVWQITMQVQDFMANRFIENWENIPQIGKEKPNLCHRSPPIRLSPKISHARLQQQHQVCPRPFVFWNVLGTAVSSTVPGGTLLSLCLPQHQWQVMPRGHYAVDHWPRSRSLYPDGRGFIHFFLSKPQVTSQIIYR